MPRPTRIRQPSCKLSSGDFVVQSLTKTSNARNSPNKLHSTKGNNNEHNSNKKLLLLRSPVLRDRTNLIKEPTTKLHVLTKGRENQEATDEKMKAARSKRTKLTKPTASHDTENIQVIETKKNTQTTTKKEGIVLRTKKTLIPPMSNVNSNFTDTKSEQKNSITRVTRTSSMKNKYTEAKSSEVPSKMTIPNQESKLIKKTRAQKNSVPNDKSESPLINKSKSKPRVSAKLSETRKKIANRSSRATRLSTNKLSNNKSVNTNVGKKFFTSKLKPPNIVSTHSKISPMKRPILGKTRNAAANRKNTGKDVASKQSTSFRLRQPTLRETIAKQPKKVLRPRKNSRNYCEESHLSPGEAENKNELEIIATKKGPVYTSVQITDEKNTDKDKVYEFVFDSNDVRERTVKKRKKRMVRNVPAKRPKISTKKPALKPIIATELTEKKIEKQPVDEPEHPTEVVEDVENPKNSTNITIVTAEIHSPPVKSSDKNQISVIVPVGPRIISIEDLEGENRIELTSTPLPPQPIENKSSALNNKRSKFKLRPSTHFKTMMNASLLRRSLSPIKNQNVKEIYDSGSPWRVPTSKTFSRVKNVFQSTPQGKKFTSLLSKASLISETKQELNNYETFEISEQNNENINTKKSSEKIQTITTTKSPRKFGTVISNINNNSPVKQQSMQINTSKSPRKFGTVISNINESPQKKSPITNKRPRIPTQVEQLIINDSLNTSLSDYNEPTLVPHESLNDKENSAPKNESPNKSIIRRSEPQIVPSSPINTPKLVEYNTTDLFETELGPADPPTSSSSIKTSNLKQSNLNKFLNLPDMPSSTQINTAHGIFDDAHSTPINGKAIKKKTIELNVDNAFGFDDDDDDNNDDAHNNDRDNIEVSAIMNYPLPSNQQIFVKNELQKISMLKKSRDKVTVANSKPARLSLDKMKKILQPTKATINKKINEENKEKPIPHNDEDLSETIKDVIRAKDFSDTFDHVDNETDKENIEEVPLFIDLEPVHFIQPPRFSYGHKRRRNASYNTSGETEDEEEVDEHHKRLKKKKLGKAEREQQKQLDQWAKNMNSTFEEIDHFDLLVE